VEQAYVLVFVQSAFFLAHNINSAFTLEHPSSLIDWGLK
jgi:hypothetical protein